ncbi:MAG: hypothetical protein LQ338_007438 [Usnochroma carphineum]|nr:MAG: hypothetical protein LQ338_007438 [Usnochroma carphineum]
MEHSSSPGVPVVQGFTPINRGSPSPRPTEPKTVALQAGNADKIGKKRSRKVPAAASKPLKGARQKQPKKAKQSVAPNDHDISKAFTVTKPNSEDQPIHAKSTAESSPDIVTGTNVRIVVPYRDKPLLMTQVEGSPGTIQQSSLTGLGSIYEAAFLQKKQHDNTDRSGVSLLSGENSDKSTRSTSGPAVFEPVSPSTFIGNLQPEPLESFPADGSVPLGAQSISDPSGFDSTCQVPCSSGINPEPIESSAMTTSLAFLEQGLGQLADSHKVVHQIKVTAPAAPELAGSENKIDHGDQHDIGADPMDIDDAELSDLMSEFTNVNAGSSNFSSEHLIDPVNFSLSSDIDPTVSSPDDDIKISSDPTLIESSSPYLQSRSNLPACSPKEEVSDKAFIQVEQQSDDEDTYNDEDLEAVLQCFDSPPSAQAPPASPPTPPIQELTKAPRWVLSNSVTPVTSPLGPTASSKQDRLSRVPGLSTGHLKAKDILHKVSFNLDGTPIPFIRSPFPPPIRDRSPIVGLSSGPLLRTCFRIGEALNAGSTALRTKTDVVIELYARVVHSERPPGSVKQCFRFSDIFSPDKPPFLNGTYGLWKGVALWDLDSKVFLGEKGKGKMARAVGRILRDEKTRGLEMTILSIWAADWDDVGICKGHYCG